MGCFQNAHEILQELNISWENLSKQIHPIENLGFKN